MPFGVQGEMVGSGKALAANLAEERARSGVFSRVPRQLVRAGKGVATVGPRAGVGSFSCVDPHVSLQVGALGVNFITAGEGTAMVALHLPGQHRLWPRIPSFHWHLGLWKGRHFC